MIPRASSWVRVEEWRAHLDRRVLARGQQLVFAVVAPVDGVDFAHVGRYVRQRAFLFLQ